MSLHLDRTQRMGGVQNSRWIHKLALLSVMSSLEIGYRGKIEHLYSFLCLDISRISLRPWGLLNLRLMYVTKPSVWYSSFSSSSLPCASIARPMLKQAREDTIINHTCIYSLNREEYRWTIKLTYKWTCNRFSNADSAKSIWLSGWIYDVGL